MKGVLFLVLFTFAYVSAYDGSNGACANLGDGYHLKNDTGCKTYYSCSGGVGLEYNCPDGYLFDPDRNACAEQGSFVCPSAPVPLCPSTGVSQIPVPGTFCKKYAYCVNGQAYEFECAPGLLFDEAEESCNFEHEVPCLECPQPDDPFNLVYHPNKQNCKGYYICLKGQAMPQTCAEGLHYSETEKQCLPEDKAECKYIEYQTSESPTTTPAESTSPAESTEPGESTTAAESTEPGESTTAAESTPEESTPEESTPEESTTEESTTEESTTEESTTEESTTEESTTEEVVPPRH
uniref:CSON015616 protein n=1 Tax=Culicoides sonorensis TaxID=179676 RepID=A0A336M1M0_CULSO